MKVASVDPGRFGAWVFFEDNQIVNIVDTPLMAWGSKQFLPDPVEIRRMLTEFGPDHVVLERVTTSPRSGVSSAGNFLQGLGILQGVCSQWGLIFVRPQVWKGFSGLSGKVKAMSVPRALRYYPAAERFLTGHKNAIDRADAILIGRYAIEIKLRGDENADKRQ